MNQILTLMWLLLLSVVNRMYKKEILDKWGLTAEECEKEIRAITIPGMKLTYEEKEELIFHIREFGDDPEDYETLKGHIGNITCVIQLRDTNFASSSVDHTIKIWKGKKEEKDKTFNYEMAYDIRDFSHGIYKLIQLEDDRLCGTSSTNQIVFWRNRSGSY